ncbi:unnamed protein product, partial [Pleuronectes platessa]
LARQLLERNITVVGTVRKNKPELPLRLVTVKGRAAVSSVFAFTPAATLVSYVPKRRQGIATNRYPTLTANSMGKQGQHEDSRRWTDPAIIVVYLSLFLIVDEKEKKDKEKEKEKGKKKKTLAQ